MNSHPKKKKNPLLALVLSGILPGLGQLYNRQILKALLFFVPTLVLIILAREPSTYLLKSWGRMMDMSLDMSQLTKLLIYSSAATVILVAAMIDAKKSADRINEKRGVT